ncbi:activator of HSP90 ATPase [Elizabethkingia miricola]|uniref:Activator of HSP90 ATPase n=1 Tax=Elizabethkingia miricola TaxID=172045 RepID=A0AAQ1SZG5_ELIMR|nr:MULTISPECIES: SRPBCC family protein [Elizabethkingia]KUY17575.1 activator of HSP90 ATPase [Elizabethkingia miricola]MCL1652651.1 SRPBCC family protein [Elizabethkingia miricola]MCL1680232.1 SRPBCC family protein [Elizabethkingia miricola]MDQ8748675.1 SRPBCC family protein [Elizabethkingia miricola]OPB88295.1 activator of HSP90 ATPase [Elizabethkingia miricola]
MEQITIETTVNAPVDKVWDYFNQPEHITQWNFAHESWFCPSSENDLRVGGKFNNRMEARDGSFGFNFEGTYDEVVPQQLIKYHMPDGRKVSTTFEAVEDGTKITTAFDPEAENPVEMQKDGWNAILGNFSQYTETH